jgi:putative membrane protein
MRPAFAAIIALSLYSYRPMNSAFSTFPPQTGTFANAGPLRREDREKELIMKNVLIALLALISLPALAADKLPEATQKFIDTAAVANKFEIDTSELALKYGKGADVKAFAQEMIDDHKKIGEEFKATLTAANITPPKDALDLTHEAKYAKLRVFTTEAGFDSSYVSTQLAAHEDAVKLFGDYAENGPTPAVKEFAAKTLPKLEHHLAMVKELSTKYTQ